MNKTILLDNRPEAIRQLGQWFGERKLIYNDTIVEALKKHPKPS